MAMAGAWSGDAAACISTPALALEERRRDVSSASLLRRLQRLACSVLRCGPVPRHVAFITDGNRRYADTRGVDRAAGHAHGFEKVCGQARHVCFASKQLTPYHRSCLTLWSGVLTWEWST